MSQVQEFFEDNFSFSEAVSNDTFDNLPYYEPKRPKRRAVEAAIITASTATLGLLGTGLSYGALKMYRIYEKSKMKPKALYYAEVDL